MANDAYMLDINEAGEDYQELFEEMHMWKTFDDVLSLVQQRGLPFVLSNVLRMMEEKGIQ